MASDLPDGKMSTDDAKEADDNQDESSLNNSNNTTSDSVTGKRSNIGRFNNKNAYKQKYKPAWELDNGLRDWLTACRTDPFAAFCRYCRTKLHAHKKGLLAHAKSSKHKKHITNISGNMQLALANDPFDELSDQIANGSSDYMEGDSFKTSSAKKTYRVLNENLLKDPQFSKWLRRVPNNTSKALCIACRCVISAGRSELIKHSKSGKHQKSMKGEPFEEVDENELQWLDSSGNLDADKEMSSNISLLPLTQQQIVQAAIDLPGMLTDDIIQRLEKHVPLDLAESWDNVGVITKPTLPVRVHNILLTIGLTEKIVQEAIRKRAQFIISYHPPIFHPVKKLNPDKWMEKAILLCVEHKIAIYSPHTALDAIKGGINDWLISSFLTSSEDKVTPITYSHNNQNTHCLEVLLSEPQETVALTFKDVNNVTMTDYGNSSTDVRVTCNKKTLPEVIERLARNNCAQVYSMVTQMAPEPIPGVGMGRSAVLAAPLPLYEVIQRTKSHLDLTYLRLALSPTHNRDTKVNSIAVCAGSGSGVLKGCKADVFITGEMSHHEVLDANNNGITVILCEHTNTERGFLRDWSLQLKTSVLDDQVMVSVSEVDRDPLRIV